MCTNLCEKLFCNKNFFELKSDSILNVHFLIIFQTLCALLVTTPLRPSGTLPPSSSPLATTGSRSRRRRTKKITRGRGCSLSLSKTQFCIRSKTVDTLGEWQHHRKAAKTCTRRLTCLLGQTDTVTIMVSVDGSELGLLFEQLIIRIFE
jgi:hypothetical protein